jgi:hypothetical protein
MRDHFAIDWSNALLSQLNDGLLVGVHSETPH